MIFVFFGGGQPNKALNISICTYIFFLHLFYSLLFILSFQQHCCLSMSCSSLYVIYKVLLCMSYIKFLVRILFLFQFFRNKSLALLVYLWYTYRVGWERVCTFVFLNLLRHQLVLSSIKRIVILQVTVFVSRKVR